MNSDITKYAFLAGSVFFIAMGLAHFMSFKVPVLFVYYDTPFYAYQDKIISFAVFAYMALLYAASKHRDVARLAIAVMAVTVAGLSYVNLSPDLAQVLEPDQSTLPYWLQTGAIAFYCLVLLGLYLRDGKSQQN